MVPSSDAPASRRRTPKPLDEAALKELALAYAARFATTRTRLERYLARKLKERGWCGAAPPDAAAAAARLVELGYVDDRIFAEARARGMTARGLGARRVGEALAHAGVAEDDRAAALDGHDAVAAAVTFARRRRLGPFARVPASDPASRQKALAAMLRGGHALDVARRVLGARGEADIEALLLDA